MSRLMEELIRELRRDVRHDKAVSVAKIMLSEGELSLEKIAKYSELPLEEVKSLADNQPA